MKKISIFMVFFLLVILSCSKDKAEPFVSNCVEEVTFDSYVSEILDKNCAYSGCHNGTGAAPGNYAFYSGVRNTFANNDEFENRVVALKDMPPNFATGPTELTADEFEKILCWIESGYPEN